MAILRVSVGCDYLTEKRLLVMAHNNGLEDSIALIE